MRHERLGKSFLKDDIRYRGPLSYAAFKLLGWLCLSSAAILALIRVTGYMDQSIPQELAVLTNVLDTIKNLSLPFFLIGNFAVIIDNKKGYKRQLLTNFGCMLLIAAGFCLGYYRYIIGILKLMATDEIPTGNWDSLLPSLISNGFLSVNIFVDLFLCSLFMFFLNYVPTKHFSGKKVILFRLCTLFPVVYEVASLTAKGLSALGRVSLPAYVSPLLTVKPPMTFVVFIILAAFIKMRERFFRSLGYTHEEYRAFLKTRRNSWHFSVFTAIVMLLAGLIDLLIYLFLTEVIPSSSSTVIALAIGVGDASSLLLLSPLMLLFSYTRRYKNATLDLIVPMVGWGIIGITVLEGIYQLMILMSENIIPIP